MIKMLHDCVSRMSRHHMIGLMQLVLLFDHLGGGWHCQRYARRGVLTLHPKRLFVGNMMLAIVGRQYGADG